jgi:parvulin-like peptidyl-prolyl isomerase
MLDPIRNRIQRPSGAGKAAPRQHVTRRDQELRQRRMLYIFAGAMGAIAIAALIGGAVYQYWLLPRQDLATVNGEAVERRDYWKVRELQLRQNIAQLSQQYSLTPAEQQPQIEQQIVTAQEELDNVEDAPVAADTLSGMVDDLLVLQSAEDLGITISNDEIDQFVDEQFAPVPLASPSPTATIEPTAAAWATGTTEAENELATAQASETAAAQTATVEAASPEASPSGTPEDEAEDEAVATESATGTESADATGTPDANGTPDGTASPEASPAEGTPETTETPTPNAEEALATSETTFDLYDVNFLEPSDIGRGDYERLVVRPALAREKITDQLEADIPARAEQVHAAHILVATEDAAKAALDRVNGGEDFGDVAREISTDTGTAGSGGDLGWFPRGVMVEPFTEAAFSLQPGEISAPVQSEFGWHIIKVIEREDDRPVTLSTLQSLKGQAFDKWLQEQRDAADVESDVELPDYAEEAPADSSVFEAPPDAPIPPTPTLAPVPTEAPVTPEPEDETGASPTP